jgi:uncharacterized protein (DUF433 family)
VESIPGKRSGEWVFRDTRMPVATVFENLEDMRQHLERIAAVVNKASPGSYAEVDIPFE